MAYTTEAIKDKNEVDHNNSRTFISDFISLLFFILSSLLMVFVKNY
jgi:hypothetical protein